MRELRQESEEDFVSQGTKPRVEILVDRYDTDSVDTSGTLTTFGCLNPRVYKGTSSMSRPPDDSGVDAIRAKEGLVRRRTRAQRPYTL